MILIFLLSQEVMSSSAKLQCDLVLPSSNSRTSFPSSNLIRARIGPRSTILGTTRLHPPATANIECTWTHHSLFDNGYLLRYDVVYPGDRLTSDLLLCNYR